VTGTTKAKRNKDRDVGKLRDVSAYFAPTRMPLVDRHMNVQPSSHRMTLPYTDDLRHDPERPKTSTISSTRPTTELPTPEQIFRGTRSASVRSKPSTYLHWSDTVPAGSVDVTGQLSRRTVGVNGSLTLGPPKHKEDTGLVSDGHNGLPKRSPPVPQIARDNNDVFPDPKAAKTKPSRDSKAIVKANAVETGNLEIDSTTRPLDTRFSLPSSHIRSNSVTAGLRPLNQLLENQAPQCAIPGQETHSLSMVKQAKHRQSMPEPAPSSSVGKLLQECDKACITHANVDTSVRQDKRRRRSRAQASFEEVQRSLSGSELHNRPDEEGHPYVPHQTEYWKTPFRPDFDPERFMIEQDQPQGDAMCPRHPMKQYSAHTEQPISADEYEEPTDSYREVEQAYLLRPEYGANDAGWRSGTLYGSYEVPRIDRGLEDALAGFWRPNRLY
jgi:hypothetical protein